MKRAILFLLTAFTVACSLATVKPIIPKVQPAPLRIEEVVEKSIVRLTLHSESSMEWYICTAFSIDDRKFLTAAHCVIPMDEEGQIIPDAQLRANGMPAFVLKLDTDLDLAVIVTDIVRPSLKLRDKELERFEDVHAVGYGEGFLKPLFTDQRVMLTNYKIAAGIAAGTVFMHPFIGGMSGGPVYDYDGLVVGIVQRASDSIGYGVPVSTIKYFLNKSN